ncbi:DMT family transporter [Rhodococcoides fascians]|uniref:DMT family transporter n=1 Tax=Rhodococcoides fascians TaxID=1828 RepID=UPI00068B4F1A|nr:DMT family transporter [Rhodococcus fascians]
MAIGAGVFLGADYVMWNVSVLDVGASIATVLINVQVVVLPLIALVVDRTAIPRRFLMAVPCMLLGVALAGGLIGGTGADNALRGSVLGIAAGAAYAAYLFLNRRSAQRSPSHLVTPICVATASATVTAGVISTGFGDLDLDISAAAWGWMIALALLGQVAAWLFIGSGSRSLAANTVAALLLLQPVFAIAFGFVVLSERPTWIQLAGAVVVGAVWTATRRPHHPDSTSSHGRGLHAPNFRRASIESSYPPVAPSPLHKAPNTAPTSEFPAATTRRRGRSAH